MDKKTSSSRSTFKVMCYLKKNQMLKNGEAPIYIRITLNGAITSFSSQHSVLPSLWSQSKEISKGKDRDAHELNDHLSSIKSKLKQIQLDLELKGKHYSAQFIKNLYLGKVETSTQKTILALHSDHNDKCTQLIGIEYSQSTIYKFNTSLNHLQEFMKKKLKIDDIPVDLINEDFIQKYSIYLKKDKGLSNNTATKQLKIFKKIIRIALANNWIKSDPFFSIKFKIEEVHIEFLSKEELDMLVNKEIENQRLARIKDVFVFCCFTGLAFIDVKELKPIHILKDNDNKSWIRKPRQKTNNMSNIPLLKIPLALLEKYSKDLICMRKEQLLPVPTNAKMNAYLKEIAIICGINKNLTTHTARHTFATTVTLANKVTLKNVSKMLGHSSTRMTEHYAKVLDQSIMQDMISVDSIFNN